jgi:hypothetical protein
MFCTFTTVVLVMTVLLTTRGPPQPCHDGWCRNPSRPHQGTSGSPHPSATQPTTAPMLMPTLTPGPPKKATSAGAYTGLATTGPGAQAQ